MSAAGAGSVRHAVLPDLIDIFRDACVIGPVETGFKLVSVAAPQKNAHTSIHIRIHRHEHNTRRESNDQAA